MSKYFMDNGFLSNKGKELTEEFKSKLESLFGKEEVKEMTESELQTLGSNLSRMIGERVSTIVIAKNTLEKSLTDMSDDQFVAFMKSKYGDRWMLVGVTKEELDRVRRMKFLTDEQIREALARGAEARVEYLKTVRPVFVDPGLRFK